MTQELMIGVVLAFGLGWAGARAYVKWRAGETDRRFNAMLKNIAWFANRKETAFDPQEKMKRDQREAMIAALVAATKGE